MPNNTDKYPPRFRIYQTKPSESWWFNRLKENPIKAASVSALVLGGVMLIMFFSHLQELPDLDLAASASMLWALAVIGGIALLFIGVISMLPGAHAKGDSGAWRQSTRHLLLLALPAAITFIAWLPSALINTVPESSSGPFSVIFLVLCIAIIWLRRNQITNQNANPAPNIPSIPEFAFDMFGGMVAWGVTIILSFVVSAGLHTQDKPDNTWSFALIFAQMGLIFTLALLAAKLDWSSQRPQLAALAIASILVPAILSENFTAIGVASVRFLGLGERPSRIIVTAEGCEILNNATGMKVCEVTKGNKTAIVCPAILKSRIGTPYFIEFAPISENGIWPEQSRHPLVPLAKSEVLSWPKLDLTGQTRTDLKSSTDSNSQTEHRASEAAAPRTQTGKKYLTYLNESGLTQPQILWLRRQCQSGSATSTEAKENSALSQRND